MKHEHSVWAVLSVENDVVLTGSADRTIKLWKAGKNTHTYTGHTDAVRSLALYPGLGFVSCSNDCTVRVWTLAGECVQELSGHTSFVYTLAVLPSGEIASGGEDRSVRTIVHPCTSIWSVAALPNGDIISGGSDGVARVFTRAKERVAEAEVVKTFEASVAATAIPSNQVGDVDKSKLPGLEVLNAMGKKDGEVKMVRVGDMVEAHQWSMADAQWHKVGEVVDAVQGKKVFDGKEYDYVFDIDIGQGPTLKLPYNTTENPYMAAQDFIDKHELSQNFLDDIANFIIQNAKGVTLGASDTGSNLADPFTGGSRYVPGGATPGPEGGGRFQKGYTFFKAANTSAILTKIIQLNSEIEKSMEYGSLALSPPEVQKLESVVRALASGESKFKDMFKEAELQVVEKVAYGWPASHRFPGIDILRLTILYSPLPIHDLSRKLAQATDGFRLAPSDPDFKTQETNIMLALRAISNAFNTGEGVEWAVGEREKLIAAIRDCWRNSSNKNLRTALATVFLNYAVLLNEKQDDALRVELLGIVAEFVKTETDAEAEFRCLVTLGTLIHNNENAKEAAKLLDIADIVRRAKRTTGDAELKLKQVEKELLGLLR
ncbi:hypothetical protein HK104_011360 [Borealophlyctis nickersoniae]|nr:hypothetical protein HK104_011360 [Borealophlyctis nickersoniae]